MAPLRDARGSILRHEPAEILADLHCLLHGAFQLHHLTIHIEPRDFAEHSVPLAGF
ncbi:MAG TPA: hypothetical protein VF006_14200 [Longimicrobium sp.]